jgi:hypothetical protein
MHRDGKLSIESISAAKTKRDEEAFEDRRARELEEARQRAWQEEQERGLKVVYRDPQGRVIPPPRPLDRWGRRLPSNASPSPWRTDLAAAQGYMR